MEIMGKALLSVFDKAGIVDFAAALVELGYEIISTGGTYNTLKSNGVPVTYISEITEFPEILDGRVKTLHPRIHGGILAKDTPEHLKQLSSIGGALIDLVAVNLYPFELVSQDPKSTFEEVLENIDIGGPTLIRAAAKNHPRVLVVSDPKDYDEVISQLKGGEVDAITRKKLAAKAFAHTAYYDTLISDYLGESGFTPTKTIALKKVMELRYGENPIQQAAFYRQMPPKSVGLADAEQIHGKQLSFNNIYDADAAWRMACEFDEPCVVAVKHTNPCGLAVADSLAEAYQRVYEADPVSIFGGIVACNRPICRKTAEAIQESNVFLEIIIAPDFLDDALEILTQKKNLRLLKLKPSKSDELDWKKVRGGVLLQTEDNIDLIEEELRVVTKCQPTSEELADLRFAWKVVKHVKSNAIVVCKDRQLIGVGAGQMNRVQSVRLAIEQAGDKAKGAVMASDAFFPFADSIETAHQAGITAIIQPGGSIRDKESIDACDKYGIAMLFTGIRHFKH
ncbi:MAG: bifunctional phosphoribosylaminoimidazolecarboxamide formyltransferase/IMP cyclohydrolase [Firmicutes bacterium]|nr:bifunctional phosphoribosylaminoimidazolecarboxamide formyltransferase/IMP cyclohydrolase [Bacillota bacterium]